MLGPLKAIGALVAGGAFFKDAIDASKKLTGETLSLTKALGLTGTQASTLRTALSDIGSDSETYIGAFQKFAKQIKNNEQGLKDMGLQTRDANGNLRDSNTLMTEALQVVGEYKPGLDQTTAAMTLFGKGVNEVMALQKLNNGVLEAAKKKNEELYLGISKEGVDSTKKYNLAMVGVGQVFLGIKNVIAQAVMPIFTQLATWFNDVGPTAVFAFKVAIDLLATALQVVIGVLKETWNIIRAVADPLFTLGRAIKKLLTGDVTGASDEMSKIFSNWADAGEKAWARIGDGAKESMKEISNLWSKGTEVAAPKGGGKTMGDFSKGGAGGKDTSRLSQWESDLAERKLALEKQGLLEGQYREMSKADEAAYWALIGALGNLSSTERIAVTRKTAEMEMAAIKQGFEARVGALNAEAAAFKNNTGERLRIEREIQAKYQEGTKEYEVAAKKIVEIERQAAEQAKAIANSRVQADRDARLQTLALEEQTVQTAVQLGIVTRAQELAAQAGFENRRNAIARDALAERMQAAQLDPDRNPVELEKINREMEQLERQHVLRLAQIRGAATVEAAKYQSQFFSSLSGDLQTSIGNILNRTQSLTSSIRGLFASLGQSLTRVFAQMASDWIIAQLKMRLASAQTSLAEINNSALSAAGHAYDAVVGIPYVGPFLAPAAAAVAYGGVLAFGASVSAAGGYDIPGNVNPIIQAHAKEMVLPAKQADVIRDMADGGGAGGGDIHLHVHAMDAGSVKRLFMSNRSELAEALKAARRDFAF